MCVLRSSFVQFFGPAAIFFPFVFTGLRQWPHKQHQYRSTCLLILTQEINEMLDDNIELPMKKRIAQYQFKVIILSNDVGRLGAA